MHLENLPLVGSPITISSDGDTTVIVVFVRECQTHSEGNLRADDTVAAEEVVLGVVQVHRTTYETRRGS